MQEVARASGFSRAAVSMALRGDRTIPESTRLHIQAVARKLGYRTNPMVASLMSLHRQRKSFTGAQTRIAWLASHPQSNPWRRYASFVSMFHGARSHAAEKDFALEEFDLRAPGMTAVRMREILDTRNITGVLIGPLPHEETRLDFDISNMAVAGLGMSITFPMVTRVANDHFQSASLAVAQCARLGYRRVGIVVCEEDSRRLEHRWLGGYRQAIEQYHFDQRIPPLMPMRDTELPSVLPGWLKTWKPDVVILNNNEFDIQKLIPVSTGMILLGVDRAGSALSGIWQNYELLGRMAVESIINRLYTNNFDQIQQAQLHLVSGSWEPGLTAPGPGRRRPSVATLRAKGLATWQVTERRQ